MFQSENAASRSMDMNEAVATPGFAQRVRDGAYALWESEGRPFGRDVEHWRRSEEAALAELTPAEPVEKAAQAAPEPKRTVPALKRAAPALKRTASARGKVDAKRGAASRSN
jgi:hypothetical protein